MINEIKSALGINETHTLESWNDNVKNELTEAQKFYKNNVLDDLTDIRLRNKVPEIADQTHELVLEAPSGVHEELRKQLFVISMHHTEITILLDMDELEQNIKENREIDDERANEIYAEVIVNQKLHKPVEQGVNIIESIS